MKTLCSLFALVLPLAGPISAQAQDGEPAKSMIGKETQQAIDDGLACLAKQQAADGPWGDEAAQGQRRRHRWATIFVGLFSLPDGH